MHMIEEDEENNDKSRLAAVLFNILSDKQLNPDAIIGCVIDLQDILRKEHSVILGNLSKSDDPLDCFIKEQAQLENNPGFNPPEI